MAHLPESSVRAPLQSRESNTMTMRAVSQERHSPITTLNMEHLRVSENELEEQDHVNISKLECHFKWIEELTRVDEARLKALKEKMSAWIRESEEVHLSFCVLLSQRFLMNLYETLLGNFSSAFEKLDLVEDEIRKEEQTGDEPPEHIRVYGYVLLADRINVLRASMKAHPKDKSMYVEFIKECSINLSLMDVEGSNCEAAFLALKGHLANQMGDTDMLVEIFKKAAFLNPTCYEWQHHVYTSLRRQRREKKYFSGPAEEEILACRKAYELEPRLCWSLLSMSQVHEEMLKFNRKKMNKVDIQDTYSMIINLLNAAKDSNPNSITANLRLAELSSWNVVAQEETDELNTLSLFQECLNKWPSNSMVWHKTGKFYLTACTLKDRTKAQECFESSLKCDSSNFPCLMDYIRLRQDSATATEVLEVVKKFEPGFVHNRIYYGKVLVIKGLLLWQTGKKSEAICCWMIVWKNTDAEAYLMELLRNSNGNSVVRCVVKDVNFDELKLELSQSLALYDADEKPMSKDEPNELDRLKNLERVIQRLQFPRPSYSRTRFDSQSSGSGDGPRNNGSGASHRNTASSQETGRYRSSNWRERGEDNTSNGNGYTTERTHPRYEGGGDGRTDAPGVNERTPRNNYQRDNRPKPTSESDADNNWRK